MVQNISLFVFPSQNLGHSQNGPKHFSICFSFTKFRVFPNGPKNFSIFFSFTKFGIFGKEKFYLKRISTFYENNVN
jgi:hypothetical protein